jgi:hypothetical protein
MLTRLDAIHHLLRLGLITPAELLDGNLNVFETIGRNHMVRVERQGAPSFTLKQPRDSEAPDSMTMWTEAAIFWLTANDPEFARLARWLPHYYHYQESDKVLTIEYVTAADSLMAKLIQGAAAPGLVREVGEAFAMLHGAVSRGSAARPSRRLFRADLPWALTLGAADMRFAPTNPTAAALLGEILRGPGLVQALGRARADYRTGHVIHGDAKAANILILDDGSIRLIDWEIATMGDGLWDLAGMVHSLLLPNPMVPQEPLPVLRSRAAPLLEALCGGYAAGGIAAARGDWHETVLRLTGARILQTCLECVYRPGPMPPAIPSLLAVASALLTRPHEWKEGWRWAA